MDIKLIVFVCTMVLSIAIFMLFYRYMLKKKRKQFNHRKDMTPHDFYIKYYSNSDLSEEAVINVLWKIAGETEIPIIKIRPQDRFSQELAAVHGWEFDDGTGILFQDISDLINKSNSKIDITKIKTVNDYIHCFVKLSAHK